MLYLFSLGDPCDNSEKRQSCVVHYGVFFFIVEAWGCQLTVAEYEPEVWPGGQEGHLGLCVWPAGQGP